MATGSVEFMAGLGAWPVPVRVTNQNAVSGKYYCHDHEGDTQGNVIKLNAIQ